MFFILIFIQIGSPIEYDKKIYEILTCSALANPNFISISNAVFHAIESIGDGGSIYIICSTVRVSIRTAYFEDNKALPTDNSGASNGGALFIQCLSCDMFRICGFGCSARVAQFGFVITADNEETSRIDQSTITCCPRNKLLGYQSSIVVQSGRIDFVNLNSSFNEVEFNGAGFQARFSRLCRARFFTLFATDGENSLDLFQGACDFDTVNMVANKVHKNMASSEEKGCLIFVNSNPSVLNNIVLYNNERVYDLWALGLEDFPVKLIVTNCFSDRPIIEKFDNPNFEKVGNFEEKQPGNMRTHVIQHLLTQQCYAENSLPPLQPTKMFTEYGFGKKLGEKMIAGLALFYSFILIG